MEGGGFEPPKRGRNRFTVCPLWPLGKPSKGVSEIKLAPPCTAFPEGKASEGNRTLNLLITNQLLCRLSYASKFISQIYEQYTHLFNFDKPLLALSC